MRPMINADPHGRVALQGYDPVAFHADRRAVRGDPGILSEHDGYRYLFATKENKAVFEQEPQKYLPAYGGYCAYGVSLGVLFPVSIDTWEILDGRLVLQFSDGFKKVFEQDQAGNIRKADEKWRQLEAD